MEKEKLEKWANMSADEKLKWNGFKGFVENKLFKENNAFMMEDKRKLSRRRG